MFFPSVAPSLSPLTNMGGTEKSKRLESVDICKVDGWYEAGNSDNVRAVLGIFRGQEDWAGKSRKRRRMDDVVGDAEDYV